MVATRQSFLKSAAAARSVRVSGGRTPLESTTVGGVEIRLSNPPEPQYNRADLGILVYWFEPRSVFANSAQPGNQSESWNWSVSDIDTLATRGDLGKSI
jgi:hypothetical protein